MFSTTYGQKLSDPKYVKNLSYIHDKCAPLKVDYIRPFFHGRIIAEKSFSVNFVKFRTIMDPENALWTIKNGENYAEWIVKITCGVAECFTDSYLDSFLPVCWLSVKFCELILPRIVFLIIQRCESSINALCDCVNQFFRYLKHICVLNICYYYIYILYVISIIYCTYMCVVYLHIVIYCCYMR